MAATTAAESWLKMTENEMQQFINENRQRICDSDAYYQQYEQAKAARDAILKTADDGSPTAATDLLIVTVGCQCFPVGYFNAEAVAIIDDALLQIMQNAVGEIYLADADKIV